MTALVSPAGDAECLKAALYAGADEVYFGLSDFSARKNAGNFTLDEAVEAITLCRLYGVKVNIAINTLLYSGEYAAALNLVERLESAVAPDSYIIQDIGLAHALSERFPGVSLHASTQMQVHGSYGNALLKKLGFTRVVLARELTREDIQTFVSSGMETEVFVHGAMCVCRSGGCLMSSMIGKRSRTRGDCAYPCRMKYNGGYPLSLKDLCLAGRIPELTAMGVGALKIEGRMKSPEYVYGVTSVYRRLLNENRAATQSEILHLKDLFSRSGFTDGYYSRRRGKSMFGVRTGDDKEKTRLLQIKIEERKIPLTLTASCKIGEPAELTLSARGATVTVKGFTPEKAEGAVSGEADVLKRLTKLGGTAFFAEKTEISAFETGFYPVSALNALRRDAVSNLEKVILQKSAPIKTEHAPLKIALPETCPTGLTLRFEGNEINKEILGGAKRIEIPVWKENLWRDLSAFNDLLSLILPGFIFESEAENIKSLIKKAASAGITQLTLPNLTFLPFCEGFTLHGDYGLNCISDKTASVLETLGFTTVCASPEAKISIWRNAELWRNAEKLIYGRVPLMNTKNCIITNCSPCSDGRGFSLTDRTSASFPVFLRIRLLEHYIQFSAALAFGQTLLLFAGDIVHRRKLRKAGGDNYGI